MKKVFITIIVMLLPLLVNAESVIINGINYKLDSSTKEATVIGSKDGYSGNITIPSQVSYNGYTYIVTSIGGKAFSFCGGLTSVTIPNSVTYIGDDAFDRCSGLTSVTIGNSVTSIGECAFFDCSSLTSVHISDVGRWCEIVINSTKGSNPLYYAHHLFLNGVEIKDLHIPNDITHINDHSFSGCSGLTSVTIGNSVTSIGSSAFAGCFGLTSVTISNSVTSIGYNAFAGCSGLTSVSIPNSVTSIGERAFSGCSGLTSITVNSENTKYDSRNNCNAIIETTSNTLVAGCNNSVIPNSVTSIGNYAFYNCSGLISITIPNSVTSIGYNAFYECSGLTSITIPNSVTSIGSSAFQNCSGLISATIGNSVTSIGQDAFYGTGWYNNQPDGLVYAGKVAYKYKGTMPDNTSITIKDGTIGIAGEAFRGCFGLTSITIPNSVTTIGYNAFYDCSGLTSITIPNSVTSIGRYAIAGCSGLTSVISEITKPFVIDDYTFSGNNDFFKTAILTVPSGTKNLYLSTAGWNKFQIIVEENSSGASLSINGINYQISSESGHTMMVSKGDYGRTLEVPATISYGNNTWSVIGLTDGALDDSGELAAIIWNPLIAFNARVSNPNLLLYVKDKAYKSSDIKNVVVNGVAESIELTDAANGNDFYCPRTFTAKKISYTHDYKMETGFGESKGWETIVLPFDVQKYTHSTKGEVEPFTTWNTGSNTKPFWLFELTASVPTREAGEAMCKAWPVKSQTIYQNVMNELV